MSGGILLFFFFFFNDTFRRERSLTYQNVLRQRLKDGTLTLNTEKHAFGGVNAPPSLSLKDVNPIKPLWLVLRRWNNVAILSASGEDTQLAKALRLQVFYHRSFVRVCIYHRLYMRKNPEFTLSL